MSNDVLKIGEVEVGAGKKKKISLRIGELPNGSPMNLDVIAIRGVKPGPTFYVGAGIHGEEVTGMEAVKVFASSLDPKKLKGTLIAVPCVNTPAFIYRSRLFPLEQAAPSNVGGGSGTPSGKLSQRVTYLIDEVASKADYALDIHATAIDSENYPRTTTQLHAPQIAEDVIKKMDGLAEAMGLEVIEYRSRFNPRSFIGKLVTQGIPTVGLETGEGWRLSKSHVQIIIRSIKNLFKHVGMLEGSPELPPVTVVITKRYELLANKGGLMNLLVKPGDYVSEGDEVAVITNMFNDEVERPKAPASGIIIRASKLPIVFSGARVCCVYETPKAAEWRGRKVPKLEQLVIDLWTI